MDPRMFHPPAAWADVCHTAVAALEAIGCTVKQVKAKFGMLRIYFDAGSDDVLWLADAIVEAAEKETRRLSSAQRDAGATDGDGAAGEPKASGSQ